MKLYMIPSCPFVQRVLIGCQVRKITSAQMELVHIDLSQPPQQLLSVNPTGSVPTLIAPDGSGFHESHVVMQFLDSLDATGPRLFGQNAYTNAQIQAQLELCAATILTPLQQALYCRGNANALRAASAQLRKSWADLEARLTKSGGPFVGGAVMNAIDVSLAPFLVRWPHLLKHCDSSLLPEPNKPVQGYITALINAPEVRAAMPSDDELEQSVLAFSAPHPLLSDCFVAPRTLIDDPQAAVSSAQSELSCWRVEHDGKGFCLRATFEFATHSEAVRKITWLHDAQETTDHHTSITLRDFQSAEITLVTHEPDWGVTRKDLALAKAIQANFIGTQTK